MEYFSLEILAFNNNDHLAAKIEKLTIPNVLSFKCKCMKCGACFESRALLQSHTKEAHPPAVYPATPSILERLKPMSHSERRNEPKLGHLRSIFDTNLYATTCTFDKSHVPKVLPTSTEPCTPIATCTSRANDQNNEDFVVESVIGLDMPTCNVPPEAARNVFVRNRATSSEQNSADMAEIRLNSSEPTTLGCDKAGFVKRECASTDSLVAMKSDCNLDESIDHDPGDGSTSPADARSGSHGYSFTGLTVMKTEPVDCDDDESTIIGNPNELTSEPCSAYNVPTRVVHGSGIAVSLGMCTSADGSNVPVLPASLRNSTDTDIESTQMDTGVTQLTVSLKPGMPEGQELVKDKVHVPGDENVFFQCDICNRMFESWDLIELHLKRCHRGTANKVQQSPVQVKGRKAKPERYEAYTDANISGSLTDLNFKGEYLLKFGMKQGLDILALGDTDNLTCLQCNQKCKTKERLKQHMRNHIAGKPCMICSEKFDSDSKWRAHMLRHAAHRPFKCKLCPKAFKCRLNLLSHSACHTTGTAAEFPCDNCEKIFNNIDTLRNHVWKCKASKRTSFPCKDCEACFETLADYQKHRYTHRVVRRPYLCPVCGKSFPFSTGLKRHSTMHEESKPFTCMTCGKSFTRHSTLVVHTRIHTGEKPFLCSVCGRGFSNSCDRNRHLTVHRDEKPFICDILVEGRPCGKAFKLPSQMGKHKKTHFSKTRRRRKRRAEEKEIMLNNE